MPTVSVELKNVRHRYGSTWALAGVDLCVAPGSVVAITGPNGCGKSTLLKILATRLTPTSGTGSVCGLDLLCETEAIRERVQWLGHELGLYKSLTIEENLSFSLSVLGLTSPNGAIGRALDRVGLGRLPATSVAACSSGMRKRLALARLLLHPADLRLLDEPHTNLDAEGRALMNTLIGEWKRQGATIILASHDHAEVMPFCDLVVRLDRGRME
ncbi:MAG: heme ABC exporter ATP-binding protein CcmA [Deltaproteobacteria bacterium]|nr:heme ABC exporter ATP-binding protein CcmA [Deltaproteobacteria bacterium]